MSFFNHISAKYHYQVDVKVYELWVHGSQCMCFINDPLTESRMVCERVKTDLRTIVDNFHKFLDLLTSIKVW